jgi:hypothetical protein
MSQVSSLKDDCVSAERGAGPEIIYPINYQIFVTGKYSYVLNPSLISRVLKISVGVSNVLS